MHLDALEAKLGEDSRRGFVVIGGVTKHYCDKASGVIR